jgi:hypothetical protein
MLTPGTAHRRVSPSAASAVTATGATTAAATAASAHLPSPAGGVSREALSDVLSDVSMGAAPESTKQEIKDSKLIFDLVWRTLVNKRGGVENMRFPREIVWLSGAPGAGKGTMCGFIMKERDIPLVFETSSLLTTPEMQRKKEQGVLIGDT